MSSASRDAMQRPIFVAIGGDSGSGKSTLTAGFYRIFPRDQITSVCLDDYHGLDRRERSLIGITALNPRANNFALMENQLLALKRGNPIMKPVYDHSDGTFGPPEEIQPREVVIVQGLHPFLVPGLRGLFDLNVWLDPETELKHKWKVQRDVAKRGYTPEQVCAEIAARKPDVAAYITPQRRFADLIVRFCRPEGDGSGGDEHLNVRIVERATLPRLNLEGILREPCTGFRIKQGEDAGRDRPGDRRDHRSRHRTAVGEPDLGTHGRPSSTPAAPFAAAVRRLYRWRDAQAPQRPAGARPALAGPPDPERPQVHAAEGAAQRSRRDDDPRPGAARRGLP